MFVFLLWQRQNNLLGPLAIFSDNILEVTDGVRCQEVAELNTETSYETTPKWHGFLINKLAETVNRLNVEHRTSNIER